MSEHSDQPDHESGGRRGIRAVGRRGHCWSERGGPAPPKRADSRHPTAHQRAPGGSHVGTPSSTRVTSDPGHVTVDTPLHGVDAPSPAQDATLGTVRPGLRDTLARAPHRRSARGGDGGPGRRHPPRSASGTPRRCRTRLQLALLRRPARAAHPPPSWRAPTPRAVATLPTTPSPSAPKERRGRGWLAIAAVAALIGGAVGAGVTALFNNGRRPRRDPGEHASPGAATLSGNVTIPSLVQKVLPAVVSIV